MAEQYFMGLDGFIWFVGVVENRNDPAELGRVQVRCLGYHTEDLTLIPTADLPWAHVMHPVTDPSMQGLGNTPSFLVEGSWVVGFFRDAREKQQPIIMGTLPGYSEELPDTKLGFNDPTNTYPAEKRIYSDHGIKESDVSRLARGKDSETHESLKGRRDWRQDKIPTAIVPYNSVTDNTQQGKEERKTWDEPDPRGHESDESPYPSAKYPYNHVHESEAGHIHEIDDTPGSERLMQQHSSGTFTEIHPDGTKVVKVVGDNYEIIVGKSNILVTGDANITYDGNVRQLIRGDYILEVDGDYSEKINKNKRMKVGASGAGNLYEEVKGTRSSNVDRHVKSKVGMDFNTIVGGNDTRQIQGLFNVLAMDGIVLNSSVKSLVLTAQNDITMSTGLGSIDIKAATTVSMAGVLETQLGGILVKLGDLTTLFQERDAKTSILDVTKGTMQIIAVTSIAGITSIAPTLNVTGLVSAGTMSSPKTIFADNLGPH
jgi:hypothetical protein